MVFVKNVRFCEAECGEYIGDFAKQLVEYRKESVCDVIARFNDVYIEVKEQTSEKDIIDFYHTKYEEQVIYFEEDDC